MLKELILKNRSYRRYDSSVSISNELLIEWVDNAMKTPSARNSQPLRFIIVNEKHNNEFVFKNLKWAGYLKDWGGPNESEKPSSYILILVDKKITENADIDIGIVAQTICLQTVEEGYGACMFKSFNKKEITEYYKINDEFSLSLVVAIGKPNEKIVIDEINLNESIKYYRDNNDVHHVPKIRINDLILNIY